MKKTDIVNFVDNLITKKNPEKEHHRWIYRNKYSYIEKSKIPCCSIKKIERVLNRLTRDFTNFNPTTISPDTYKKLGLFKKLIEKETENYKSRHCEFYKFVCRILFGDINEIRKNLNKQIDRLRHCPIRPEPKDRDNFIIDIPPGETVTIDLEGFEGAQELPEPQPAKIDIPVNLKKIAHEEGKDAVSKYTPYVAPLPDKKQEFADHIKQSRLKFYERFSEILKVPHPDKDDSPLRLPLMEITCENVKIRVPRNKNAKEFCDWLENQFKGKDDKSKIEYKSRNAELREIYQGIPFSKEYTLSLVEANKFIQAVPNRGIGNLTKLLHQPELEVHHCHISKKEGNESINEPSIENTISLTFAHLNPSLHSILGEVNSLLHPQIECAVPLVAFDDDGMSIKISDSSKDLNCLSALEQCLKSEDLKDSKKFKENLENIQKLQANLKELVKSSNLKDHLKDLKNLDDKLNSLIKLYIAKDQAKFDENLKSFICSQNFNEFLKVQENLKKIVKVEENLKDLLKQLFGFIENNEGIEEVHFGRSYPYTFRVERNEIENVLKYLGLEAIPSKDLHKLYSKGDITYLQHLIETKRYHAYRPERKNAVLESIIQSLKVLVPNELDVLPHVSFHPRGWLSIKLPNWSLDYNKMLLAYLKYPSTHIDEVFNENETYTSEIIIYEEEIFNFLKKLKLEDTLYDFGNETLEKKPVEEDKKLNLMATIGRTLSALEPLTKAILDGYNENDLPEIGEVKLVQASGNELGLDLKIPNELYETKIISLGTTFSFGKYLESVFGLEKGGKINQEFYNLHVPIDRVKSFLEKDLSLRLLKPKYRDAKVSTYFNLFIRDVCRANKNAFGGVPYAAHASVADLSLRNPSVPIPEKIPEISDQEILKNVSKILLAHPKKESYLEIFAETFKRISPGINNPDIREYNAHKVTADNIRSYLKLVMHELINNKGIKEFNKREAITEIATGCSGKTCLPGRLTKIQAVYQHLKHPELDDKVKFLLLDKVEEFKNDVLAALFAEYPNNVHIVNAAKVVWWKCGLDKKAGELDDELSKEVDGGKALDKIYKLLYLTEAKKKEFINLIRQNLVDEVFYAVQNDKNEEGFILNIDEYQNRLRKILRNEGIKPSKLDAKIACLIPTSKILEKSLNKKGLTAPQIKKELERAFLSKDNLRKNLQEKSMRKILNEEKLKSEEIDAKIKILENDPEKALKFLKDHNIDTDEMDEMINQLYLENRTITKEGVKLLLLDIGGLLNP